MLMRFIKTTSSHCSQVIEFKDLPLFVFRDLASAFGDQCTISLHNTPNDN